MLTLVTGAAQRGAQFILDDFYSRSGFPVPFFEGQLSFSATRLEGWYAQMTSAGTLDVFRLTQAVDFVFIAATAAFLVLLTALVARAHAPGTRGRRLAGVFTFIALVPPIFDVLENIISFLTLREPTAVPQVLAVLHSISAAIKFAGFGVIYLWVVIGMISAAITGLRASSGAVTPRLDFIKR